jgi:hypothetical protein
MAPAQQYLAAELADLTERPGDENGLGVHGLVHRPSLRANAAPTSRIRGETQTEKTGLNMSSRNRVSVEVLIRHRPSAFSYVSW